MQIHIGKPNNFWATQAPEFSEHRDVYTALTSVLLAENHPFEFYEHRPWIEDFRKGRHAAGPVYAYHAERPGLYTYCLKRGPLPYLWHMNAGGYSGWCSLAQDPELQAISRDYAPDRAGGIVAGYKQKILSGSYALISQPDAVLEIDSAALGEFVFFPLQVNNDEVMKLSPFAQFDLIYAAGEAADRLQKHIVFKRHPLCTSVPVARALEVVLESPFVHVSAGPTEVLIQKSQAVVLTNSSVGVQSLILDRPVFSFGDSEYAHMTTRLDAPNDVERAFLGDAESPYQNHMSALAYLLDAYLVDMTDPAKIAARFVQHIEEVSVVVAANSKQENAPVTEDTAPRSLTLIRALEKDSRELLDMQLEMYGRLEGEDKAQIARSLSRLARSGHWTERIIKYTDDDVAHRCMRYLSEKKDDAGLERIALAVIARDAENAFALHVLSKLCYARDDEDEGAAFAERAASAPDASASVILFYARKMRKTVSDDDPRLRALVDQALGLDPKNARGLWLQSIILLKDGQVDLARDAINQALELEPNNSDYLKVRAELTARK